ncbi:MAG: AarF/ABC1/UbiB kinase family protein, partial [Thermodesulfobacteriota bacterium]|nr:AarF/ABC1/UbiB kinase family protein [Thermodesulfobacteriota bacterium]
TRLIKQQKLNIKFEHKGFEPMLETHNQISNRISFSIIIGSLIIGSAIIVFAKIPPLFNGLSIIGIVGFISAAMMGIWLLIAILRKGRL